MCAKTRSKLLEDFFSIVGSGYGGDSDAIIVFGRFTENAKLDIINELVDIVIDLVFLSLQTVPNTGKWTKTSANCERNMIGNLNNLQKGVIGKALGALEFKVEERDCIDVFGDSTVEFNKIGSKSSKAAMKYYNSLDSKVTTQILAVITEGFRLLTSIHMSWCKPAQ